MPCITVDRKWWVEQKHICCLYVEVDHKIGHKGNRPKTTKFKWKVYYIKELQMWVFAYLNITLMWFQK